MYKMDSSLMPTAEVKIQKCPQAVDFFGNVYWNHTGVGNGASFQVPLSLCYNPTHQ